MDYRDALYPGSGTLGDDWVYPYPLYPAGGYSGRCRKLCNRALHGKQINVAKARILGSGELRM